MTLRNVEYEDTDGRKFLRGLPEGVPDTQAVIGVPIGPPSLLDLGLPLDVEVRLHNQLYARGLFTEDDVRQRIGEVQSALMVAYRTDVQRILLIYHGADDGS